MNKTIDNKSTDLCIYHANCADGFCAAWLYHRVNPNAEFIPASYGDEPPDVRGRDVVILDFSYPREQMIAMKQVAHSLIVIDHHKTAMADLEGLDFVIFDMEHSGAYLTQRWFTGGEYANHWMVAYTEDRDLWQWKLPYSREINAALRSYPQDFYVWDDLQHLDDMRLVNEGEAILRAQQQTIDAHVKLARETMFHDHVVLMVNATTLISEIGGELAKGRPFSVTWREHNGNVIYSLRSDADGLDVAAIAKAHGGGGHKHAAGFSVGGLDVAVGVPSADVFVDEAKS